MRAASSPSSTCSRTMTPAPPGIVRWPDGFVCPASMGLRRKAHTFECAGCRRQTSVTAGTILHASKLPLTVLGRLPDGDPLQRISALQPARYRLLPQRLAARAARQHGRERNPLSGLDEASLPFRSSHRRARTQPRRKMLIVGAIELGDGNIPGRRGWPKSPPTAPPTSDLRRNRRRSRRHRENRRLVRYAAVPADRHNVHVVGKTAAHLVLPWIHQVFSNLKGWARGVYHGLRRKHLQAYLDEVFRFNRRKTRHAAFRSLFRLATNAEPLTYSMLIEPEPCGGSGNTVEARNDAGGRLGATRRASLSSLQGASSRLPDAPPCCAAFLPCRLERRADHDRGEKCGLRLATRSGVSPGPLRAGGARTGG